MLRFSLSALLLGAAAAPALPRTRPPAHDRMQVVGCVVLLLIVVPPIAALALPLGAATWWLHRRYVATSREVKRFDAVTRSPVVAAFSALLKVRPWHVRAASWRGTPTDRLGGRGRRQLGPSPSIRPPPAPRRAGPAHHPGLRRGPPLQSSLPGRPQPQQRLVVVRPDLRALDRLPPG